MRNFVGALLMAVGVLIAGTAGLCALLATATLLDPSTRWSLDDAVSVIALIGAPMLVGLGLFWWGRKIQGRGRDEGTGEES